MKRPARDDDWEPDDDDFDPADGDDADDDSTIPCPYCRRQIYDDAVRCPHCGQYLSDEDAPPQPKRWWVVLGVVLCLLVALMWILQAF